MFHLSFLEKQDSLGWCERQKNVVSILDHSDLEQVKPMYERTWTIVIGMV